MLVAVRHGRTSYNDNGGEGGAEKFRGWLPIALDKIGMEQARQAAELVAPLADENPYSLYSSDVVRAVQTAHEVARGLNMEVEPREELRDWNLGDYVGKPVDDVLDEVLAHIDTPDKKIPGGESYNEFLARAVPFICELVESENLCIAVTHARIIGLIMALAKNKGEFPDPAILKAKPPVHPGGIFVMKSDWTVPFKTDVDQPEDMEKVPASDLYGK